MMVRATLIAPETVAWTPRARPWRRRRPPARAPGRRPRARAGRGSRASPTPRTLRARAAAEAPERRHQRDREDQEQRAERDEQERLAEGVDVPEAVAPVAVRRSSGTGR